jgi:cell division protein FtsI/penicillin-binding protein 2
MNGVVIRTGSGLGRDVGRAAVRPFLESRQARGEGRGHGPRARRARLVLLIVAVGAGLLAIAGRCAHLQVIRAPELLDQARSQQEKTITLDPPRGPILDRNGRELAVSLDVDSAFAEPAEVADPAVAARRLAPVVGVPAADLRERLSSDRRFVWIKRKITPDLRKKIAALGIRGIGFVRESRRYYPKRTLAAHLIGACGMDNQGLDGLEFMYDSAIRGTPGRLVSLRDGRGGRVLDREQKEPTPGAGLSLTVDEVIQYTVERALDDLMATTGAEGATVVVLRPQTGEILALGSRPTFDPNAYAEARETARRDRATTDYYEPGSTFKIVTAAAALDSGRVRPQEVIWCENGSITVAKHRFKEDRLPYGNLTFTEVLAKSSNVGAIKVAQRLQPSEFISYIRDFGFGHKTGIDLPGESPGVLRDVTEWSGLSQASMAMGQEIGVTTLQLTAMLGAVANDGVWVRPRVVRTLLPAQSGRAPAPFDATSAPSEADIGAALGEAPPGGGTGKRAEAVESRRVISESTARSLRAMLQAVTTEGTGKAASIPGYTVGGKTGTAQKADQTGHYAHGKYVSWFAGFVPAGRPALAIVVMVDEPRGAKFHGGDVAAPVFARVAQPTLMYLKVPPDHEDPLVFDRSLQASLSGGEDAADPTPRVGVRNARLVRTPTAGAAVVAAKRVRLTVGGAAGLDDPPAVQASLGALATQPVAAGESGALMPDLTGMSLREASESLASLGLICRNDVRGDRVTRQVPEPGTPMTPTTPCMVIY